MCHVRQTLEKTEEEIENRQSRQTDNIGYTKRRQTKQKTQDNICQDFQSLY
jgi:hypothetical protein